MRTSGGRRAGMRIGSAWDGSEATPWTRRGKRWSLRGGARGPATGRLGRRHRCRENVQRRRDDVVIGGTMRRAGAPPSAGEEGGGSYAARGGGVWVFARSREPRQPDDERPWMTGMEPASAHLRAFVAQRRRGTLPTHRICSSPPAAPVLIVRAFPVSVECHGVSCHVRPIRIGRGVRRPLHRRPSRLRCPGAPSVGRSIRR